jgi:uncharacterized protein (TIGR03437 family)
MWTPRTLVMLLTAIGSVDAQTASFVRQFSSSSMDEATTLAVDASGVYVIGGRPLRGSAAGGGGANAQIRKYDSRGNELWTREFSVASPGPQFARAAADATGLYVVLWESQVLRKYSADGAELWTRRLDFRPLAGITVGPTGIYAAGRDFVTGAAQPYLANAMYLSKYSSDGAELWTRRWGEANVVEIPYAVTQDSTGVYVLGVGRARKYDAQGNELWTRALGAEPWVPSLVAAAEPTGFFVVAGQGGNQSLRRYDAEGNAMWTRPLTTTHAVYVGGIAADATGVYMTGTTDLAGAALAGQCKSGSGADSFVRKFSFDGTELWTREFGTSDSAWATDVAVDSGGVYAVGRVGGGLGDGFYLTEPPVRGAFLARFDKSPAVISGPRIFPECIVNAASYVGGGIAPREIVTVFGSQIGPQQLMSARAGDDGRLPTTLADTRILFDGVPAPLLYVSNGQSSAIVPSAIAGRTSVEVQVEYRGVLSDSATVPVLASRPGILTLDGSGRGQGAVLNEDGSVNSASNPARRGSVITIFATGGGEAASGVADGQIVDGVLPRTTLPVSVVFDFDSDAYVFPDVDEFGDGPKLGDVLFAGGSRGSVVGLLQINVRVPEDAKLIGDAVPLALIIGSHWTAFQTTFALR